MNFSDAAERRIRVSLGDLVVIHRYMDETSNRWAHGVGTNCTLESRPRNLSIVPASLDVWNTW